NFRFDDIRAALGLAQLKKLQEFNRRRAALVRGYNERLSRANLELMLPSARVTEGKDPSYHIYPVVLPGSDERKAVCEWLRAEPIQPRFPSPPIHCFSAFQRTGRRVYLPVTEAFAARELTLPLYPAMTTSQLTHITDNLQAALASIRAH